MNQKNTIITVVAVIVIIILAIIFWPRDNAAPAGETPMEALDNSTQYESTDEMEANLDSIDVEASSNDDFKAVDSDIQAI